MRRLRSGVATWRRLGLRKGTAVALDVVFSPLRKRLRRARLRTRPLRVGRRDLARALNYTDPASALRERALPALPTVAAWERELDAMDSAGHARLIERAERMLAHRFNLLGSGPTDLGQSIDWQLDFKSGRRWPDMHISLVPTVFADDSDIKVPWELGRCQHFPLLAAAYRIGGDKRFLDELGAQTSSFIAANPVEFGAPWSCTMDVAIRAANWVAALCLAVPAIGETEWLEPTLASLLLHCRFIRSHLEWAEVRGNHYLSDVAGLLVASAPFSASKEGRAWATWAAGELEREMAHQVHPDGCDRESSIPYHRLVTELFVCGGDAADALCPGTLSKDYRTRLEQMLEFVSDYTRPDGLAPQIGDADDGRFLPLGDYGADPRDHRHLYAQAGRPWRGGRTHATYPEGGWHVMRHEKLWGIVRCGGVTPGLGGHAHNDQLSFELALDGQPLVVDPGSYVYTADPHARNEFRSTRAHSTLSIGACEQNRLRTDYLFALADEAHAQCLRFEIDGPRAFFEGEHTGFRDLSRAARHRRELRFDGESGVVHLTDTVFGAQGEELLWSFPLAPGEVAIQHARALARFEHGELDIESGGAVLNVENGWLSPSYGVRVGAPVVRARRIARSDEDVTSFTLVARKA